MKSREAEESITRPIANLHKYLTAIVINPKAMDNESDDPEEIDDSDRAITAIKVYARQHGIPIWDDIRFDANKTWQREVIPV